MPTKRHKYSNPIQFFPRSSKDILKDDPSESQNIIVPLEPEHFKYGIYFNDGYDYSKHLVSLEEFNDDSIDLKEMISQRKPNMMPYHPSRSTTVIQEYQIDNIESDEVAIEKLKELMNKEDDQDVINCLNDEDEFSDIEDNFVELADGTNEQSVVTGDKELFNRFFQNDVIDDDINENDDSNHINPFNSMSNVRKSINDISERFNFESNYNLMKRFKMPSDITSRSTIISKSFVNALERVQSKNQKKDMELVDTSLPFYQNLNKEETEYNEEEVDRALDQWVSGTSVEKNKCIKVHDAKLKVIKPIEITIEKLDKKNNKRTHEKMDCNSADDNEEMIVTDVSKFHVPRPVNETAEEKRERKKAIKSAKRCRKEEKKISRKTFAFAKNII